MAIESQVSNVILEAVSDSSYRNYVNFINYANY